MTDRQPPDGPGDSILPPDWDRLAPLLDRVLDAEPADRERVLDAVAAGHANLRAALERLLADSARPLTDLGAPAASAFGTLLDGAAPLAPALPAVLGDRYRTAGVVGQGGMARVYLARDLKHDRDVAVKVILDEVAALLGRERFLREIAIAARLRHPNIVPLFDSGDANGVLYFVMPYEAGPSLSARLAAQGPLPVAEALSVLRDVARALQYAHEQGVVHRDIKPDNVMLSGGAAVVADFGIAKAVSVAQSGTGGTITQTGAGIGTPAYMAPEQAVGDPASDRRADLYSFGCLAFAAFTGAPPFTGMSTHQLIAAHVTTVPPDVRTRRAEVPPAVAALVARCLAKEPADRPQDASEIVAVMDGVMSGQVSGSAPAVMEAPPARRASRVPALVGGLLVLAALVTWRAWPHGVAPRQPLSLSVLPLSNISGDSSLNDFAGGLTEELFTALGRVPGIQMRSRSGARAFGGRLGVDTREAGRVLNVEYLVTGTMREVGGVVRISAELTRTADGTELWSRTFDRTPTQQIGLAEEIATAAAATLRDSFPDALGAAPRRAASQQTRDPEAYRLYVLGQELLNRRGRSVIASADAFRQAVARDPSFAGAHAGLSVALALFPYFQGTPQAAVAAELEHAARTAIALDPTLSQPHVALGMLYTATYAWARADLEFKAAIASPRVDAEAYVQYGRYLNGLGRAADARAQFDRARELDPASPLVLGYVAFARMLSGEMDSAVIISQRSRQAGMLNFSSMAQTSVIMLRAGMPDSALAVARQVVPPGWQPLYVLAAAGDTATALRELRSIEAIRPEPATVNMNRLMVYLGLRDTARALDALERATDAREPWPNSVSPGDAAFDLIRTHPRTLAVLRRIGLPPSAMDRAPQVGR